MKKLSENSRGGPRLLDCTFRDGGYTNEWSFNAAQILDYSVVAHAVGVDALEVAFRLPADEERFRGVAAYGPRFLFAALQQSVGAKCGLMVNQKDCESGDLVSSLVSDFAEISSGLNFVRVATHMEDLAAAGKTVAALAERLGVQVFLNLMQVGKLRSEDVRKASEVALDSGAAVLCLADSFGSMNPDMVKQSVEAASSSGIATGFHGHDNLGLALANSIAAFQSGADWVDGTARGIGRGAGNTRIEQLLIYFRPTDADARLLDRYMEEAHKVQPKEFGFSPEYALAAAHQIHPTVVDTIVKNEEYARLDRLALIEHLGRRSENKVLDAEKEWFKAPVPAENTPPEAFEAENLLLLAPGDSTSLYSMEIKRFIKKNCPTVIAAGPQAARLFHDLASHAVVTNPAEILSGSLLQIDPHLRLVSPVSQLGPFFVDQPKRQGVSDLQITITDDEISFLGGILNLPSPRSGFTALALSMLFENKAVTVAGFDGYSSTGDSRNHDFQTFLTRLCGVTGTVPISLTPSPFSFRFRETS